MDIRDRNLTFDSIVAIVNKVSNEKYNGNVRVHDDAHQLNKSSGFRGRIDVHNSRGEGARVSWSGRHGKWACWHAYRDVLRAILTEYPNAIVKTSMARYDGLEGFEDVYPGTAFKNIGSMMQPAYMSELCECEDDE